MRKHKKIYLKYKHIIIVTTWNKGLFESQDPHKSLLASL